MEGARRLQRRSPPGGLIPFLAPSPHRGKGRILVWGGAEVARQAHILEVAGPIPAPTTRLSDGCETPRSPLPPMGGEGII